VKLPYLEGNYTLIAEEI